MADSCWGPTPSNCGSGRRPGSRRLGPSVGGLLKESDFGCGQGEGVSALPGPLIRTIVGVRFVGGRPVGWLYDRDNDDSTVGRQLVELLGWAFRADIARRLALCDPFGRGSAPWDLEWNDRNVQHLADTYGFVIFGWSRPYTSAPPNYARQYARACRAIVKARRMILR